jgi:GT2 family glycosyltransferase/glycosyltransferase involved in cell wall biosynthesis
LSSETIIVDVVIPVHNGYAALRRCIESVLGSRQATKYALVIVDDASTDPDTIAYLGTLPVTDNVAILRNEINRGFVYSANRGLALHADRDVVLLNSDTEVANDWLDRLRTAAWREPNIGTVTPFSNNATICSYPVCCADNQLPEGIPLAELDATFARTNAGGYLTVPTAIGFCMYVRRACLDAVGHFDEQRFGRGYGEENDFCRRAIAAGWRNILAADTFVYHQGSVSFRSERDALVQRASAQLEALHPDYFEEVRAFIRNDPAARWRRSVEIELARLRCERSRRSLSAARIKMSSDVSPATAGIPSVRRSAILDTTKPVQLHVMHDLAGGVERWCKDYCTADVTRLNLILRPYCRGHAAGEGLMLYAGVDDEEPLGFWPFSAPFEVTAVTHTEYLAAIGEIVGDFRVESIIVSSLIGHSLDILRTDLPTVYVLHDYFPACPAINLYFDGVCRQCDDARIAECLTSNGDFNPFLLFDAEERRQVRRRFLEILATGAVAVVSPSRSAWRHLSDLFPTLATVPCAVIPHGIVQKLEPLPGPDTGAPERLRIVVLGMLSVNKGLPLLDAALDRITEFADVHLVGALEVGELFKDRPGVRVVARYALAELNQVVSQVRPHLGMLLSIWPETFSYTLSELMHMAVPIVATRLGAFSERIIDGETGYLVEPNADALITRLRQIDGDRSSIERVRENLRAVPRRDAAEMVADYQALLPPIGTETRPPLKCSTRAMPDGRLSISQSVALTAMWKQVKSLHLQLTMSRLAKPALPMPLQLAERQRAIAENQRAVAENQRAIAEHQRAIAENHRAVAECQRVNAERERDGLLERLGESLRHLAERDHRLVEKDVQLHAMTAQLKLKDDQVAEIFASTSWKLSYPLRALGHQLRRVRLLSRILAAMLRHPRALPNRIAALYRAWRMGGALQLKLSMLNIQADNVHQNAWLAYGKTFAEQVKPRIVQRIDEMTVLPKVSIVVPTYNTEKSMLRQMVESVRGQLYPNWELCIADDCSTLPHVRRVLEAYARGDVRIKLDFGERNRGVSATSNRALAMASGEFVVLLDHDDVLEEQAIFRVAQSVLEDDPDMLYSDEIMVSADGGTVLQYAFRPAFSPEFLRGHPYFVHLVGFRTQLLRDVGGFDEALRISQDYDLFLRVAERARTVVHIPEFLYRWRIHGGSAGVRKMDDVMNTSKAILQRHLDRCGETGTIDDGPAFNLFVPRYRLSDTANVAIVIPTKNHGSLVRQCIDGIRATVGSVAYHIVVIDHDSDDPATLSYLASIASQVTVLRYSGPFNFSAINNWAVRQLPDCYSHYLFCNNDIEPIQPGWLERMLELGQRQDVGIVGAELLYPDRQTIQHAGVCVGAFGAAEHYGKFLRVSDIPLYLGFSEILRCNHEVSAVTAACLLIRKEAFSEVSGFDEALAVGFGDVDLCLRVGQLGYKIMYCPYAVLLHHESLSRGKTTGRDPHPEDSALFQARWQAMLQAGDPYFNPGLWQNSTAWQMRQPMNCRYDIRRRIFRRQLDGGRQVLSTSIS